MFKAFDDSAYTVDKAGDSRGGQDSKDMGRKANRGTERSEIARWTDDSNRERGRRRNGVRDHILFACEGRMASLSSLATKKRRGSAGLDVRE